MTQLPTPTLRPARSVPRWLSAFVGALSILLLLAVLATGTLWWWAGTDGSLATSLRWIAHYQPLTAQGATGSLRAGGQIEKLVWQQDGMTVEASNTTLAWQPWSLLHGTLKLNQLHMATVRVDDQRPPPSTPALPPTALGLPLRIALDDLSVGELRWSGPPAWTVSAISGNYLYTGLRHEITLTGAQFASGHYQGKATLVSTLPLQLDAVFSGTLSASVPGSSSTLPLSFSASAKGPLTELDLKAALQMQPATASVPLTRPISDSSPHANATARIMPWAAQPVAQADADFKALNLALLWPDAPQTSLTGSASLRPGSDSAATSAGTSTWSLQAQLVNALPGPLDKQRLPLENLQAQGEWRNGAAIVRSLRAGMGGGTLLASGAWLGAAPTVGSGATATNPPISGATRQDWSVQASLQHVNPAALHSQLAAAPFDGRASVKSQGAAVTFDASLQAPLPNTANAASAATKAPIARAGTPDQLRLRDASATGSWTAGQAGGTLVLSAFRVRTADAELGGSLEMQPTARAGKGNMRLSAPGLDAQLRGELRQTSGAGNLTVQARDAMQALGWLQRLPGLPAASQRATATGQAQLAVNWQGGWQDPALQASLDMPSLDLRLPATPSAAEAITTTTTAASVLKFRAVQASLTGQLSQAALAVKGQVQVEDRRYTLQLLADGGRVSTTRPETLEAWASSGWQSVLKQLTLSIEDPALGVGAWRFATRGQVALRWTPAKEGGTFEAGAGEALLSAPERSGTTTPALTASTTPALVQWQPVRWRGGEVTSAGKITGLPLAWIELLAGPQMAGAGLSGNLLFDGAWDVVLGTALRVKASLTRSSGDLTIQAETAPGAAGAATRVAAGVREARLSLDTNSDEKGNALTLALRWVSERAGTADAQLSTRLDKAPDGGWRWPADAPLRGQLRAQLPRIGVWSVLAPPGWRLRGTLGADVTLSGTRNAPLLAGDLSANDLALRSVVDGIEFGKGRLRARLDGTRMRISEFTLQGSGNDNAGGTLKAQGEAAWVDGKPQVQLDAKLDRLRASIRTDRQLTLSGDLQAKLDGRLTQFTGHLKIDQARILLPDEGTPQLGDDVIVRSRTGAAAGQKGPAEANAPVATKPPAEQDARAIRLAVQIDLGQDFRVQGKGIDTRVRGLLTLTGDSLTEPRLNGTVNTFGGQYRAYGQRLDVEQGVLRFSGPIDNPALDILAIRPNLTQRVGVQILGTALLPRVRLYAQPELPDAEKLSWLVLGRASASGGAESALLQQAAVALLGSKSGGMSGGLAAALGLDELSFRGASNKPDGSASEGAVTLGKRFSRNFYAAYERSISGALGTLFVFYDLSQRFTVRAQAGQQSAVDLIYTLPYD